MKLLENRILKDGRVAGKDILRVDTFINHQVDPELMQKCAKDFASHFKGKGITKVVTIESSGISPAVFTALEMGDRKSVV